MFQKDETSFASDASETCVVVYLFSCYSRLQSQDSSTAGATGGVSEWLNICVDKIFTNCLTCLLAPAELYYGQNCAEQLLNIYVTTQDYAIASQFISSFLDFISQSEETTLKEILFPLFTIITKEIRAIEISYSKRIEIYVEFLMVLLKNEDCCLVFLDYHKLSSDASVGKRYEDTLLGAILQKSTIVADNKKVDFFRPSAMGKAEIERQELYLKSALEKIHKISHDLIKHLLHHKSCRNKFHVWLASCVRANKGRVTLRGVQSSDTEFASDGFFLNLAAVCLKVVHV